MARPVQAKRALRGRFDLITISIHWFTAALVLTLIATGLSFELLGDSPLRPLVFIVHRSLGVSVWVVAWLRLAWRMTHARFPAFSEGMNIVHRWVVTLSEYALYALLLLQPVTGMAGTLLSGKPFGLFFWTVPALLPRMTDASIAALGLHHVGAFWLIALVGGHAIAALMHHFLAGDDTLKTMAPWVKLRSRYDDCAIFPGK
jgi:cytochrome b561